MRVNAITSSMTYSRGCKIRQQTLHKDEPENNVAFQGLKGGVKGGVIGAAAALALAAVAGPFGFAILPLWTTGGAIAGHTNEEANKPNTDSK